MERRVFLATGSSFTLARPRFLGAGVAVFLPTLERLGLGVAFPLGVAFFDFGEAVVAKDFLLLAGDFFLSAASFFSLSLEIGSLSLSSVVSNFLASVFFLDELFVSFLGVAFPLGVAFLDFGEAVEAEDLILLADDFFNSSTSFLSGSGAFFLVTVEQQQEQEEEASSFLSSVS